MKIPRAIGEALDRVTTLVRRPRAYVAVVFPIAIPLILATVKVEPAAPPTVLAAVPPPLHYSDLAASPAALPQHSVILTIEDGDTLDDVLRAGGLEPGESAELTRRFGESINLRKLRTGTPIRFHYGSDHSINSVELKVNGWGQIDGIRGERGFEVFPRAAEQKEIETTVTAQIDSSLYEAIRNAGESPQLVQQLVDVFQWDIDFFALQKGDSFSVVAGKKFAGADPIGYGPIAAARFTHDGETLEAFRHEMPDGRAGYYSRSGNALRKQFLRAPLQFTRITSGFSKRRFHPLLHYFRPHHGVDYGAPAGTPVMTTADGVVLEASFNRGEGNYIRIRHTSRIETHYLHLSRFAKRIRPGARVVQGEVIGYVGSTGLATGPHLDYRVCDGGTWLDPLRLKSITPDPLGDEALRQFRGHVSQLLPRLSAPSGQIAQLAAKRRALF